MTTYYARIRMKRTGVVHTLTSGPSAKDAALPLVVILTKSDWRGREDHAVRTLAAGTPIEHGESIYYVETDA